MSTNDKGDTIYISLTDVNGNIILRDVRNDGTLINKVYTGHRYDNVTGLTYAHARYLDTRSHTFTTVDPLYYQLSSAQLYNPQLMNAYSYANNNPVKYNDPTGEIANLAIGLIGAVVGAAIGGGIAAYRGASFSGIAKAAGIGAVVGGVAGLTFGASLAAAGAVGAGAIVANASAGAVSSVAGGMTARALTGQKVFSGGAMFRDAGIGAAAGLAGLAISVGISSINSTITSSLNTYSGVTAVSGAVARGEVSLVGATNQQMTTVGRVMSQQELQSMKQGNIVVGGQNTQTYVTLQGAGQYKAGSGGSTYVEFNVPSANVLSGGKNNEWGIVLGQNPSNYLKMRLKAQGGTYPSTYDNLVEFPN